MNTQWGEELTEKQGQLIQELLKQLKTVYHLSDQDAQHIFLRTVFYRLLIDPTLSFDKDDAEMNFRRLQNEIEYGAWNKNEWGRVGASSEAILL